MKSFSLRIRVTDTNLGVTYTVTLPLEIQVAPVNEFVPAFPSTAILVPKVESTTVGDIVNPSYRLERVKQK